MAKGNMTIRMEPELKAQAFFIARHLGVRDFPLRSRLTSRTPLPMLQWKLQKRAKICLVRLTALVI